MKRKLGNYLAAAFFLNVFAIMSVGGVCILMVNDMVDNINSLEEESGNIDQIYRLNNTVQKAILMVHNSIIEFDNKDRSEVVAMLNNAEKKLQLYRAHEQHERSPHSNEEILFIDKILDNFMWIHKTLNLIYDDLAIADIGYEDGFKKLESYGFNINGLIQSINDVHFEKVSGLVTESYNKMYFILVLYLASSLVGILASCVGYVVLRRHTIKPIINLATATEKVSAGDLGVRVEANSHTEIGTLYNAFNLMTERLERHERKREDFRRTLERMVKARTRDLQQSEESLRETQSELVRMEKIATLGQIATSVNHEIKTPLNVLSMNLQLLIRKINKCPIEEDKAKQGMIQTTEIINNEISRINEIIDEFVKYARFPPPDITEKKINTIIEHLADMLAQNAKESEVNIEVSLNETLGSFPVDEKKLIQALLNLCMNAIQAMPYGGSLRLETKKVGPCAQINIVDTGPGISEEDLEHIFDPFFTKKEGGLGFGLAIVQRIIEDHQGAISCRSEVGKGTDFEIILPPHPGSICKDFT